MKKNKKSFDTEKAMATLKKVMPNYFDFGVLLLSLFVYAFACDRNLETLTRVASGFFLINLLYCLCWYLCFVVVLTFKKYKENKAKEKEEKKEVNDEDK